jgi:hypothetical protein
MGHSVNEKQKLDVWEALSDVFVDNEINFPWIAERVSGVNLSELEHIFFEEVAAYCAVNLAAPIPPVWEGFSRDDLKREIELIQTKNEASQFSRLKHRAYVTYLRWKFKDDWEELKRNLEYLSTNQH